LSLFFFSSRRRHTRSLRDWSSDVCSSDLARAARTAIDAERGGSRRLGLAHPLPDRRRAGGDRVLAAAPAGRNRELREAERGPFRSEERRVGKEWRARGWRERENRRREDQP